MLAQYNKEPIKITNIESLTDDDLKERLSQCIQVTVENIRCMASIWIELERRGVDMSPFKKGLLSYIPMVARNGIEASFVVNYAGNTTLLSAISRLPIKAQMQLKENDMVPFVFFDKDGIKREEMRPLSMMNSRDVLQVFSHSDIRTLEEQEKILENRDKIYNSKKSNNTLPKRILLNRSKNTITMAGEMDLFALLEEIGAQYSVDVTGVISSIKGHQ